MMAGVSSSLSLQAGLGVGTDVDQRRVITGSTVLHAEMGPRAVPV